MSRKKIAFGLFSNLQGLETGARRAGFNAPFSSDIEELASTVAPVIWEHKGKDIFLVKDVRDLIFDKDIRNALNAIGIDIAKGELDLLVGGPPCFGITLLNANFRSVFHALNFLMIEMLRLVKEIQPKVVLIEQVPTLLSKPMRPFFNYFVNEIELLGNYHWDVKVLNAENFGCFQSRNRAMIMLVRKDLVVKPSYPAPNPVDMNKQSAFATIGAELIRHKGFKKQSGDRVRIIDGRTKLFPTMTSSDVEIFRNGLWQKLTIQDRKVLAHMDEYDFNGLISDAELTKKLGMMVLPPFAEAICRHIYSEILEKAAA